jgi:protein SCO1/2
MKLRLVLLTVLAFAIGIGTALLVIPGAREKLLPAVREISVGKALVGGPFSLIDQNGQRVTDKDFRGKYMLVLFGFTYCPDVCPSSLQVITAALDKLGPKADRITPILISVDPERDTPEQMKQYVASFHPRLLGLTGTTAEVEAAAKAYRVYFKKVKDEKTTGEYTIDHSALIYLMGPDGSYVAHFTHTAGVDQIAARLAQLL